MPITIPTPTSPAHKVVFVNASSLKALACADRYTLEVVQGWRATIDPDVFAVGKAVHKYAELRALGNDDLPAMAQAITTPGIKDKQQVYQACAGYDKANLPAVARCNGEALVEFQFCVKYDDYIINGVTYEVYLTGRIDRVAHSRLGVELIDFKTSRKWDFNDICNAYDHDTQFLFYYSIARRFAYELFRGDMTIANDAHAGRLFTRVCPIFPIGRPNCSWRLGPLWSPSEELYNEFIKNLRDIYVPYLVTLQAKTHLLSKDGMFKNLCPGCRVKNLCLHERPDGMERVEYNPLTW